MKETSRSLCYPVYVVIDFHLVKQRARPLGFLFVFSKFYQIFKFLQCPHKVTFCGFFNFAIFYFNDFFRLS